MPLKMRPAMLSVPDRSVAKVPPKSADPFYASTDWKTLRLKVLQRDGFRCFVEGCTERAIIADHIVSRKNGGSDDMGNLRSCCRTHDNRFKEDATGVRRSRGSPRR